MIALLVVLTLQAADLPALPPLHFGRTTVTCPVGGQRFTSTTTLMHSVMGQRPDERPYSEVPFPLPMPECPDNGLVIFAAFTPAETEQLARWIATPVYQAMRRTESPFYRAYWLAKKIGRPDADAIELLRPAIWEAKEQDGDSRPRMRTQRYQRVLVAAVAAARDVSLDDRIWLQGQAANALREMGKFTAAERMRQRAEADVARSVRPALARYLQQLKVVIARRDRSDEPLDMIPDVEAALVCQRKPPGDRFGRAYCARPEIVAALSG